MKPHRFSNSARTRVYFLSDTVFGHAELYSPLASLRNTRNELRKAQAEALDRIVRPVVREVLETK